MIQREINLLVSSNPALGSKNLSADGSSFSIELQEPLVVEPFAKNIQLQATESTVWWLVSNIVENVNDMIYIDHSGTPYVLQIEQGLYGLDELNVTIHRALANAGAPTSPPLISITGDEATQKIVITHNVNAVTVDFTQPQTFASLLGFGSVTLGPNATSPFSYFSSGTANLNTVNYFLIHSDICESGLNINGKSSQVIAQVLIDTSPGSMIINSPFNPAKISASNLEGTKRRSFRFWLTNDSGNRITMPEYWSTRISITYWIDRKDLID